MLDALFERIDVDFGIVENRDGQTALLFEQRCEQALDVNLLIAVTRGLRLRRAQPLLDTLCEAIYIHIGLMGLMGLMEHTFHRSYKSYPPLQNEHPQPFNFLFHSAHPVEQVEDHRDARRSGAWFRSS